MTPSTSVLRMLLEWTPDLGTCFYLLIKIDLESKFSTMTALVLLSLLKDLIREDSLNLIPTIEKTSSSPKLSLLSSLKVRASIKDLLNPRKLSVFIGR